MDDKQILIKSDNKTDFDLAFQLLFSRETTKATSWMVHPEHGLVLFWGSNEAKVYQPQAKDLVSTMLPYPMNKDAAKDFAWGWLESRTDKDFGPKPDIDGSVKRGFKIHNGLDNGAFGAGAAGCFYGIVCVKPIWATYHK